MYKYFIIYKPFNVLSQFSPQDGKQTLKDHFNVPVDCYPVGRLDYDSEGLLILTNDKKLNHALLDPAYMHEREYWVQVDGAITKEAIEQLKKGVTIAVDGKQYQTKKCNAMMFDIEPNVPVRNPPIRFRKNIPATWLKLILKEGKNRQVRKMTAAVGFPTLRLIRQRIQKCTIDGLNAGDIREINHKEILQLLFNQ